MKLKHSIFGALLLVGSLAAQAQSFDFPHLMTSGYGEIKAEPDMAEFSVQVVETADSAADAKELVDTAVRHYLVSLDKSGVDRAKIESGNIQLHPQMYYPKSGQPEQKGYRASRRVTVVVDELTALPLLLDLAIQSGINRIDRVKLGLKDPSKYQADARLAAINDARKKAKSMAKGFNMSLEEVWQINYQAPQSRPMLSRSLAMDSAERTNSYQDTTIMVSDRVEVVYKLR